jgi:hypothetical protein
MNANAPRSEPVLTLLFDGQICTGWAPRDRAGAGEDRPAQHVGQEHVERDRRRHVHARFNSSVPVRGYDYLESTPTRELEHDARRVVLDHEERQVVRQQIVAVVRDFLDAHRHDDRLERRRRCGGIGRGGGAAPERRAQVADRQVQRKRAATAGHAAQADLATQQVRELAADREAESGAAVLARRARIGLLERLEHDALFIRRDADARVAHGQLDDRRRQAHDRISELHPRRPRDLHAHATVLGELNAFDSRFLRICSRRFESVFSERARCGSMSTLYESFRASASCRSCARGLAQVSERQALAFDRDRSHLDLRQIRMSLIRFSRSVPRRGSSSRTRPASS